MPTIPALGIMRQKDQESKAILEMWKYSFNIISVAVTKCHDKSSLKEKGFIFATVSSHSPSLWGCNGHRNLKQLFISHP